MLASIIRSLRDKMIGKYQPADTKEYLKNHEYVIYHNKELTEVESFVKLLKMLQKETVYRSVLLQNINENITSFKPTLLEAMKVLNMITDNLEDPSQDIVRTINRLPRSQYNSYIFLTTTNLVIDEAILRDITEKMLMILSYFDREKVSMEDKHEALCQALYAKLDIFHDFFYDLYCHLVNIRCDQTLRKAVIKTLEI
jgi:hypothetical protein